MRWLAAAALLLALGLGTAAILLRRERVPQELQGQLALFALAGQSNMIGYAPVPAEQAPHPRAYLFGNDYRWRPALEPTHAHERSAGTSPGVAFARAVLEARPGAAVGLVPCAKGDTTILEWSASTENDTLYGSCLERLAAAGRMGRVAGVLFFQGESDAFDPARDTRRTLSSGDYAVRFTRLVESLRRDLGQPRLPIVFAQIGGTTTPEAYPGWRLVQEQQASVRLPCVAMIETRDLALQDNVHFAAESSQEIGRRFAKAYFALLDAQECDRELGGTR